MTAPMLARSAPGWGRQIADMPNEPLASVDVVLSWFVGGQLGWTNREPSSPASHVVQATAASAYPHAQGVPADVFEVAG